MSADGEDDPFADEVDSEDGAAAAEPDDDAEENPFADDDEDEQGDSDEDDDDDDSDDDEDTKSKRKRADGKRSAKKRQRITGRAFIADDVEEVNYEDDEEEEEHEATEAELLRAEQEALAVRERRQKELEKRRKELEGIEYEDDGEFDHRAFESKRADKEVQRELQEFEQRQKAREARGYSYGDQAGSQLDETEFDEQRLLPKWEDPNMWMIQCMPGMEADVCVQLMRKFFTGIATGKPLLIKSVVANPAPRSVKGRSYVYIEAFKLAHVQEAIKGIENLRYGQWKQDMVSIEDRPNVLRVVKPSRPLKVGDWVQLLRSGDYKGDVARVDDVQESEGKVVVQVVPRIDWAKIAAQADPSSTRKKTRKVRPPQRLFTEQLVQDAGGFVEVDEFENVTRFNNKAYRDGFLLLTLKIKDVNTVDVRPSLSDLRFFESAKGASMQDEDDDNQGRNPFKRGDKVEVKVGELQNLIGTVLSIEGRTVTIQPHHDDLNDPLPFQCHELQKAFKSSDHVKVTNGTFTGETGLVVKIEDDVLHIVSDLTMKEIKVKSKDAQLANEVASGLDSLGQFELHELVQLDFRNVACIVRIERDTLFVLDQDGNDRQVKPIAVQSIKRWRDGTAVDRERNEVRKGFMVKVLEGPFKGRGGKVLHVHRSNVFIYNREILENNGVFVTRARNIKVAGGGTTGRPGAAPVPQSPHIHGSGDGGRGGGRGGGDGGRGGGRGGRGRRNELIGKTVRIIKGPLKGSMGRVKDATDTTAKIEMQARAKTVIIALNQISVTNSEASKPGYYPKGSMQFAGSATPKYGAQTPQYGSQTPQHSGARTPRYGGATPAPGDATPSRGDATPSQTGGAWDPQLPNTPAPGTLDNTPGAWDAGANTPGEWPDTGPTSDTPYAGDAYTPGGASATPYDSTPYDYTGATPSAAYGATPGAGATPSDAYGYGGYDAVTPGIDGMTPSNAYTPGTPSGSVYTPGTPSEQPYGSRGADTWHARGVWVQTVDGPEAVILEVTDDNECLVRIVGSGQELTYQKQSLTIVHPSKRDEKVYVIGGEFRNQIGTVLGIEDGEIIVQLPGAENMLRIMAKDILAKYEEL